MTNDEFNVAGYKVIAEKESKRADEATKKNFEMLFMGFLAGASTVGVIWSFFW